MKVENENILESFHTSISTNFLPFDSATADSLSYLHVKMQYEKIFYFFYSSEIVIRLEQLSNFLKICYCPKLWTILDFLSAISGWSRLCICPNCIWFEIWSNIQNQENSQITTHRAFRHLRSLPWAVSTNHHRKVHNCRSILSGSMLTWTTSYHEYMQIKQKKSKLHQNSFTISKIWKNLPWI